MPIRGFRDVDGKPVPFAEIPPNRLGRRPRPLTERLMRFRLVTPDGCWFWEGASSGGYGLIRYRGRNLYVHRVAYSVLRGGLRDDKQLDHLCRNRLCFNPTHLEPVTARENNLRSTSVSAENAKKTHCKRGHALSGANLIVATDGHRNCRTCKRTIDADRRRACR